MPGQISIARATVFALIVVLACTGVVALLSRAPASIRLERPPRGSYDASLGAHFTDAQVARNGRFRMPTYVAFVAGYLIQFVVLLLLARGPLRRFVDVISTWPGTWVLHTAVAVGFVVIIVTLAGLPLGYVTGYAMTKAWGLSTQGAAGWFNDQARSLLVTLVTTLIVALAFYAVVRWQPRFWWLLAWIALSLITALLTYLYPVAIAPLFNKFTPLDRPALVQKIEDLAQRGGVTVDKVLVADASKRTTAENAYVAGLGSTKQVVVYDTLLSGENERGTLFVVAHELGHDINNHVLKGVGLSALGLLVGLGGLGWLARTTWFWSWAGASGIRDLRGLPVVVLYALVVGLLVLPIADTVSRHFEATADRVAVQLTHDPEAGVSAFRKLAFSNIADLRPPRVAVWTLFTHPPIPDRIRNIEQAEEASP